MTTPTSENLPLVSVLIPVYNAESYIEQAVRSITEQAYDGPLEIILLDDASTDASVACAKSIADPRIVVLNSTENKGIVWQLNRGLAAARGDYILRMDADDIALPGRITQQVRFMEENPEVGACGSAMEVFGQQNFLWQPPLGADAIRLYLLRNSPLAHPTAIIRRRTLQEHVLQYDASYLYAEDYKLWAQLQRKSSLANLSVPLLRYRSHPNQTGALKGARQQQTADQIRREELERLPWQLSAAEKEQFIMLMDSHRNIEVSVYASIRTTLVKVYQANQRQPVFNQTLLATFLADSWLELLQNVRQFSPRLVPVFFGALPAPLDVVRYPSGLAAKLIVKSLVGWKTRV